MTENTSPCRVESASLPPAYRLASPERGPLADAPRVLFLEVTNACNLRCRTCVRTHRSAGPTITLDLPRFLRIVDQVPAIERAVLHGVGEPLLNPHLASMVALLKTRRVTVLFNTNATLLDEAWSRSLMASGLDELRVSLDAATAGTYRRIRGLDKFSTVVENVARLRSIQKESGSSIPKVSLWLTGSRENLDELPDLVRLAAELDVGEVYLQRLVYPLAGSWGDGLDRMRISRSAAERRILEASALASQLGVRLAASGASTPSGSLALSHPENRPWSVCGRPWTTAYVAANGDCLACCMVPFADDASSLVLGNALENDFSQIWNGEPYRRWRAAILTAEPPSPCLGCGVKWSL